MGDEVKFTNEDQYFRYITGAGLRKSCLSAWEYSNCHGSPFFYSKGDINSREMLLAAIPSGTMETPPEQRAAKRDPRMWNQAKDMDSWRFVYPFDCTYVTEWTEKNDKDQYIPYKVGMMQRPPFWTGAYIPAPGTSFPGQYYRNPPDKKPEGWNDKYTNMLWTDDRCSERYFCMEVGVAAVNYLALTAIGKWRKMDLNWVIPEHPPAHCYSGSMSTTQLYTGSLYGMYYWLPDRTVYSTGSDLADWDSGLIGFYQAGQLFLHQGYWQCQNGWEFNSEWTTTGFDIFIEFLILAASILIPMGAQAIIDYTMASVLAFDDIFTGIATGELEDITPPILRSAARVLSVGDTEMTVEAYASQFVDLDGNVTLNFEVNGGCYSTLVRPANVVARLEGIRDLLPEGLRVIRWDIGFDADGNPEELVAVINRTGTRNASLDPNAINFHGISRTGRYPILSGSCWGGASEEASLESLQNVPVITQRVEEFLTRIAAGENIVSSPNQLATSMNVFEGLGRNIQMDLSDELVDPIPPNLQTLQLTGEEELAHNARIAAIVDRLSKIVEDMGLDKPLTEDEFDAVMTDVVMSGNDELDEGSAVFTAKNIHKGLQGLLGNRNYEMSADMRNIISDYIQAYGDPALTAPDDVGATNFLRAVVGRIKPVYLMPGKELSAAGQALSERTASTTPLQDTSPMAIHEQLFLALQQMQKWYVENHLANANEAPTVPRDMNNALSLRGTDGTAQASQSILPPQTTGFLMPNQPRHYRNIPVGSAYWLPDELEKADKGKLNNALPPHIKGVNDDPALVAMVKDGGDPMVYINGGWTATMQAQIRLTMIPTLDLTTHATSYRARMELKMAISIRHRLLQAYTAWISGPGSALDSQITITFQDWERFYRFQMDERTPIITNDFFVLRSDVRDLIYGTQWGPTRELYEQSLSYQLSQTNAGPENIQNSLIGFLNWQYNMITQRVRVWKRILRLIHTYMGIPAGLNRRTIRNDYMPFSKNEIYRLWGWNKTTIFQVKFFIDHHQARIIGSIPNPYHDLIMKHNGWPGPQQSEYLYLGAEFQLIERNADGTPKLDEFGNVIPLGKAPAALPPPSGFAKLYCEPWTVPNTNILNKFMFGSNALRGSYIPLDQFIVDNYPPNEIPYKFYVHFLYDAQEIHKRRPDFWSEYNTTDNTLEDFSFFNMDPMWNPGSPLFSQVCLQRLINEGLAEVLYIDRNHQIIKVSSDSTDKRAEPFKNPKTWLPYANQSLIATWRFRNQGYFRDRAQDMWSYPRISIDQQRGVTVVVNMEMQETANMWYFVERPPMVGDYKPAELFSYIPDAPPHYWGIEHLKPPFNDQDSLLALEYYTPNPDAGMSPAEAVNEAYKAMIAYIQPPGAKNWIGTNNPMNPIQQTILDQMNQQVQEELNQANQNNDHANDLLNLSFGERWDRRIIRGIFEHQAERRFASFVYNYQSHWPFIEFPRTALGPDPTLNEEKPAFPRGWHFPLSLGKTMYGNDSYIVHIAECRWMELEDGCFYQFYPSPDAGLNHYKMSGPWYQKGFKEAPTIQQMINDGFLTNKNRNIIDMQIVQVCNTHLAVLYRYVQNGTCYWIDFNLTQNSSQMYQKGNPVAEPDIKYRQPDTIVFVDYREVYYCSGPDPHQRSVTANVRFPFFMQSLLLAQEAQPVYPELMTMPNDLSVYMGSQEFLDAMRMPAPQYLMETIRTQFDNAMTYPYVYGGRFDEIPLGAAYRLAKGWRTQIQRGEYFDKATANPISAGAHTRRIGVGEFYWETVYSQSFEPTLTGPPGCRPGETPETAKFQFGHCDHPKMLIKTEYGDVKTGECYVLEIQFAKANRPNPGHGVQVKGLAEDAKWKPTDPHQVVWTIDGAKSWYVVGTMPNMEPETPVGQWGDYGIFFKSKNQSFDMTASASNGFRGQPEFLLRYNPIVFWIMLPGGVDPMDPRLWTDPKYIKNLGWAGVYWHKHPDDYPDYYHLPFPPPKPPVGAPPRHFPLYGPDGRPLPPPPIEPPPDIDHVDPPTQDTSLVRKKLKVSIKEGKYVREEADGTYREFPIVGPKGQYLGIREIDQKTADFNKLLPRASAASKDPKTAKPKWSSFTPDEEWYAKYVDLSAPETATDEALKYYCTALIKNSRELANSAPGNKFLVYFDQLMDILDSRNSRMAREVRDFYIKDCKEAEEKKKAEAEKKEIEENARTRRAFACRTKVVSPIKTLAKKKKEAAMDAIPSHSGSVLKIDEMPEYGTLAYEKYMEEQYASLNIEEMDIDEVREKMEYLDVSKTMDALFKRYAKDPKLEHREKIIQLESLRKEETVIAEVRKIFKDINWRIKNREELLDYLQGRKAIPKEALFRFEQIRGSGLMESFLLTCRDEEIPKRYGYEDILGPRLDNTCKEIEKRRRVKLDMSVRGIKYDPTTPRVNNPWLWHTPNIGITATMDISSGQIFHEWMFSNLCPGKYTATKRDSWKDEVVWKDEPQYSPMNSYFMSMEWYADKPIEDYDMLADMLSPLWYAGLYDEGDSDITSDTEIDDSMNLKPSSVNAKNRRRLQANRKKAADKRMAAARARFNRPPKRHFMYGSYKKGEVFAASRRLAEKRAEKRNHGFKS